MKTVRPTQMVSLRGLALLTTFVVAGWATGFARDGVVLRSILLGYAGYFLFGTLAQTWLRTSPPVPLLLLFGDLLAIGAVGCWLHEGFEPQVAFLAGYVVAILVAVVGRSLAAALLGVLAGTMTLGLAVTLFATLRHDAPDLGQIAWQLVLLSCGTLLTATITAWLDEDARRQQFAARLAQAMRDREAEAAELVTFAQEMAASSTLRELAEATIRHLRCHFTVRARAIALEIDGEASGLWEEDGRLTEDHVEQRRTLLQEALVKAGNHATLIQIEARANANVPLPATRDFRTLVEVPIRAGGRVAGTLLLAAPERHAVDEGRIGTLADIARRVGQSVQRIERQGSEEVRRTALLLRQMREGVLLLGNDGRVLLANPALRRVLGCPGAGTPLPDAIGELSLNDLAQTPVGVSRRIRTRVQPDPRKHPIQLSGTVIAIQDGMKRLGTLVTLADVTEEEMSRERLLQSEKLTLVGQTLAGVAHELNNPLTALIGYADLLQARDLPEATSASLTKIRDQAFRATRIVKNLLSVARQRNPERRPLELKDVVRSVVDLFAYEARLCGVEIDIDFPERLPKVLGDGHALQQIFVNLVQNAIHALKEEDGKRRIAIALAATPDAIRATVSDTGPGVPDDLRARIFQPFFTTKGPNKGTGLGLALSRTVARDHGGDLTLEDAAGEAGARFVLRLPVLLGGSQAATPDDTERSGALELKVLVIDDERDVRESVVAQLGSLGCEVTSTASAGEAVKMLQDHRFDALLVDVRMPGMNGMEFHTHLVAEVPDQADRLVFMTGDYANEEVSSYVKASGRNLLEKPFTRDEMRDALAKLKPYQAVTSATRPHRPFRGPERDAFGMKVVRLTEHN